MFQRMKSKIVLRLFNEFYLNEFYEGQFVIISKWESSAKIKLDSPFIFPFTFLKGRPPLLLPVLPECLQFVLCFLWVKEKERGIISLSEVLWTYKTGSTRQINSPRISSFIKALGQPMP